ncbi:hypothetical protein ILYODFUR_027021 [Ilyodon furcidens]|uniref:Uncharacterized protein n=1 Tax=Ilyodon furcidens TaxID=33524 RepID=A0ABV0TBE3_9TELE
MSRKQTLTPSTMRVCHKRSWLLKKIAKEAGCSEFCIQAYSVKVKYEGNQACFLKATVSTAIYLDILEHFMLPSADKFWGDADIIFPLDLAACYTAKGLIAG